MMFDKVAERFLGMKSEKYAEMVKNQPKELAKLLENKLDALMIFTVNIKVGFSRTYIS